MKILSFTYEGEALKRVYENEKWTVGIKNWKPSNDVSLIDTLERHNETDELFVLVDGWCVLVYANEVGDKLEFFGERMLPHTVYNIPKGLWHNTITGKNAKLILIEDVSTGVNNSDFLSLTPEQIQAVRGLVE